MRIFVQLLLILGVFGSASEGAFTHLGAATSVPTAFGEPAQGLSTYRVAKKRRQRAPDAHPLAHRVV